MTNQLTGELKEKLKDHFQETADFYHQTITNTHHRLECLYLSSIIDQNKLEQLILKPFFENKLLNLDTYVKSLNGYIPFESAEQTIDNMMHGFIVITQADSVYLLNINKNVNESPLNTSVEKTILGPQKSLSESLEINLNIIRHRYHKSTLTIKRQEKLGHNNKLKTALVYDQAVVNKEVLKRLKKELDNINQNIIQSASELNRLLAHGKRTLFPTLLTTERPDRIAYNLSQGKVIVLIEGDPFVVVAPAVFFDFFSSMADFYQTYWVSQFMVTLRYLGLLISITLPAAYVGVTSFNPEIFQVQLALSIAGSRMAVPYPSYIEVFFMLIFMEMLIEASIRLPKTIGPTATTVGGLILGQAATEAGLASNIMIILVAAVAISNFVIPINEMSFAMRIIKYLLLFIAIFSGLIGLIIGLIALVYYLVNLESYGQPYFKLFFSENPKELKKGVPSE